MNAKISVIGSGAVGTSLAYACLARGIGRTLAVYDINGPKARAEVLDLAHGTQFTSGSDVIGGADIDVVRDSRIVFITAGAKQKPGQTRLELAGVNAAILGQLMPQLVERAPDAVYVLVTNPADVLTTVAQRTSGLPASRVISTGTLLDTARLRWLIAKLAGGVATSSVHASMVGEHGDSEFALWSNATIGPIPIGEWVRDGRRPFDLDTLERITQDVRNAAYRVIEGKGATNYAIGLAGARLAEVILNDERAILPVSTVLSGQWGIDDVALSMPSLVSGAGVERVLDVPMADEELTKLLASAQDIRDTLASIG